MLPSQTLVSPGAAFRALSSTPKFTAGFDTKRSFISNRDVSIFGVRVGLDFDRKIRMGFGTYFLSTPFFRRTEVVFPGAGGAVDTIPAKLNFSYFAYFIEYVLFYSKRWEVGVPFYVGVGEVNFREIPGFRPRPVLIGQAVLRADYKILPFIGLSGGVGYRAIMAGNALIEENFNSPVYVFGVKLWLDWFLKKAWPDKFGPAEEI